MSSFDAAKIEASTRAMEQWYACLRKNIPEFAQKRTSTVEDAATAVMVQCRSFQAADERASEAALASSIGHPAARANMDEINRKATKSARDWVIAELVKARP